MKMSTIVNTESIFWARYPGFPENGTPEPNKVKIRVFSPTYIIYIMKNYKRNGKTSRITKLLTDTMKYVTGSSLA